MATISGSTGQADPTDMSWQDFFNHMNNQGGDSVVMDNRTAQQRADATKNSGGNWWHQLLMALGIIGGNAVAGSLAPKPIQPKPFTGSVAPQAMLEELMNAIRTMGGAQQKQLEQPIDLTGAIPRQSAQQTVPGLNMTFGQAPGADRQANYSDLFRRPGMDFGGHQVFGTPTSPVSQPPAPAQAANVQQRSPFPSAGPIQPSAAELQQAKMVAQMMGLA